MNSTPVNYKLKICPKCGSDNVATERRPGGNHVCGDCGREWPNKKETKMSDHGKILMSPANYEAIKKPMEEKPKQPRELLSSDISRLNIPEEMVLKSSLDAAQAEIEALKKQNTNLQEQVARDKTEFKYYADKIAALEAELAEYKQRAVNAETAQLEHGKICGNNLHTEIKQLESDKTELVACVGFYANPDNWTGGGNNPKDTWIREDDTSKVVVGEDQDGVIVSDCGGRKARETLAKVSK